MKFSCLRKALVDGLAVVKKVVPAKAIKDIFEGVHVEVAGDSITLYGTDLEVSILHKVTDCELETSEDCTFVVPLSLLLPILKSIEGDTVSFEWADTGKKLTVFSDEDEFEILGLRTDEYPEMVGHCGERDVFTMPCEDFRSMVQRTAFAVAHERMRYALNGTLIEASGTKVSFVGTDGRKLSLATHELSAVADGRAIVPIKGLLALMAASSEGDVAFSLDDNLAYMQCGDTIVVSRIVEGTYPKYEDIIQVDADRIGTIDRKAFLKALQQSKLMLTMESHAVRVILGADGLILATRSASTGKSTIKREMQWEGEDLEIAFNPAYLIEGLSVMDGDTVTIGCKNKTSPVKFTDNDECVYVVMPVSLN